MEKRGVGGERRTQAVVDLVEEPADLAGVLVLQRNPGFTGKRHGNVAVHAAQGIDVDQRRIDGVTLPKSQAEEIAERSFHRGGLLAVPVHPQDQIAQDKAVCIAGLVDYGYPDVVDYAGAVDVCQRDGLAGRQRDAGGAFAALAEGACRLPACAAS